MRFIERWKELRSIETKEEEINNSNWVSKQQQVVTHQFHLPCLVAASRIERQTDQ